MKKAAEELIKNLQLCEIPFTDQQASKLEEYSELLWKWNESINLTRHTNFESFVIRDVLDSYKLSTLLNENDEVVDIGTGGGVPGVLLAILRPDLRLVLTESVGKKAHVVADIVQTMKLPVEVVQGRAEQVLEDERYDAVVARAVGPLEKLLRMLKDYWFNAGRLLAIKGPKWVEERKEARQSGVMNGLELRKAIEYIAPISGATSVILKVWPEGMPEK